MLALGDRIKDAEFTPAELTRLCRGMIGTTDIKVETTRDQHVDLNQIVVGGIYDPHEDESNSPSITIFVTYSPEQKMIRVGDVDWAQLCIDLIECSGHEIIHQSQFRARGFDIGPNLFISGSDDIDTQIEQNYLGNPDEIDAYAFSIATVLYLKYQLKEIDANLIMQTSLFKAYQIAFGVQHSIVKQLLETINSYYGQLTSFKN